MAAHVMWRLFNIIGAISDLTIFFNWQWVSKVLLMQYNLKDQYLFLSLQLWVLVFFFCVQLRILFLSLKPNQTALHPRASHPERSHLMTSEQITPTPPSASKQATSHETHHTHITLCQTASHPTVSLAIRSNHTEQHHTQNHTERCHTCHTQQLYSQQHHAQQYHTIKMCSTTSHLMMWHLTTSDPSESHSELSNNTTSHSFCTDPLSPLLQGMLMHDRFTHLCTGDSLLTGWTWFSLWSLWKNEGCHKLNMKC